MPFYRGSNHHIGDIKKFKVRKDRRPSDMPIELHNELGKRLKNKIGWNPRTEGVFTTTNIDQAGIYGVARVVFPIGKFRYAWNNTTDDALNFFERHGVFNTGNINMK